MNDALRITLLRSALLTVIPQHALAAGRCQCGMNCTVQQALSILELTRPVESYTVPPHDASRRTNGNGPCVPEHGADSTDTLGAHGSASGAKYESEGTHVKRTHV
jgi:hypothetical protein